MWTYDGWMDQQMNNFKFVVWVELDKKTTCIKMIIIGCHLIWTSINKLPTDSHYRHDCNIASRKNHFYRFASDVYVCVCNSFKGRWLIFLRPSVFFSLFWIFDLIEQKYKYTHTHSPYRPLHFPFNGLAFFFFLLFVFNCSHLCRNIAIAIDGHLHHIIFHWMNQH